MITPPNHGSRSIDSWKRHLSNHLRVRGSVTKHEHLRDVFAEWWAKDNRAEIMYNALQPLSSTLGNDTRRRAPAEGVWPASVGVIGNTKTLEEAVSRCR